MVHTVPGSCACALGPFYRVAADELVHDDGIAERLPEHRVQVGHRCHGERLTVPASASQQVPYSLVMVDGHTARIGRSYDLTTGWLCPE